MAVVDSAAGGLRAEAMGATIVQLRMPGASTRELEREAVELVRGCGLPVVVSSRVDVALATGAAGVHLPALDVAPGDARELLGPDALIGRSVHDAEEARRAEAAGAGYLVFGPVFATPTHLGREATGLPALGAVCRAVRIPVLAVGGVDRDRAAACLAAGAGGWAAIRAFA